ncbi:heavy metal translocating P-type ATPase [Rhodoferax ferrireducens]|uniref:heavy metal translocating P-type ATPase n=1 Tax=Rhodoferax ferrireducens TaxID=192843 RepID=UPI00298E9E9B|nr:heavy metal translocating P-type ATPase [Rhodoferax ferrireducens]WPC67573.1 heavy metal translocating P-type ATPase [Rhodoferax ferrireducens]
MPSQDTPSSHVHQHQHPHQHDHSQEHSNDPAGGLGHGATTCDAQGAASSALFDSAKSSCGTVCCGGSQANLTPVTNGALKLDNGLTQTLIRIMQMDCPTEEALLQKKLGGMNGVTSMDFNLMQRVLTVTHEPASIEPILEAVRSLGFTPELVGNAAAPSEPVPEPAKSWWPLALAGLAAIASEAAQWAGMPIWVTAMLAVIAVFSSGVSTYKKGWIAVRNFNLNINALMSIAVTGALLIGQWPEAAMVMVLFTIAELIEAKSLDRARNAIKGLLQLTPDRATVLQSDGVWTDVAAKSVAMQARVRVKPGERIALDGIIVLGNSTINQAPITGESLPVEKTVGDTVFAGTINESGSFEYTVTAVAGDSTLARIIHAVEAAQGSKAPTQRFVDKFAQVYTPVVFAIALGVAILPPLLLGGDWYAWIYKALVLLVIACPCALVISTPVTIVSGLAAAARRGILIKGGVYLEKAHQIKVIALDKTGTITEGKPKLVATEFVAFNTPEGQVRQWAADMAARSDHPVSRAIAQSLDPGNSQVEEFTAIAGRGVQARVDGNMMTLGNHRLVEEQGLCNPAIEALLAKHEVLGRSVTLLASSTQVLMIFAVADTIKESSREALEELKRLNVHTVMLSGDNTTTAQTIAKQAGIDDARGNLLPQDKLTAVENLQSQFGLCAMVGDGINDAPALARADVGIAMGAAGTDIAMEAADLVIMNDDLRRIPEAIHLSRKTQAVLYQNIALALGIKAVFLILALFDGASMWMAVFADMGASLLVVGNGLRLLGTKHKE